jgi:hypothetical protein
MNHKKKANEKKREEKQEEKWNKGKLKDLLFLHLVTAYGEIEERFFD